jgi:hypothetical protein
MAFSFTTIIKGLLVKQEGTLTPTAIEVLPGGTASTTTIIQGAQTVNRTLTLPDATDTLTANATAQALTNKDLSGAGNTFPTFNQNTTGTAANITASSNSTLTTLSALSLPGAQVTGNISGNATNITASSNSTLTTLSALSLPGAQVTGNISGNAANITASSNSTLTTLSALSLLGAQVTGNISGNAANVTASSNSTLTTLSALSLPLSQTTGTASIAQGGTNNGSLAVTAGGTLATDGSKVTNIGAGTTGQVLTSQGASAPIWAVAPSAITSNYFSGYNANSESWSTTASSYGSPINSGGNALTTRYSNGLTVTAAAANLPGIQFTPSSTTAAYLIEANVGTSPSSTNAMSMRMQDGTSTISEGSYTPNFGTSYPESLSGVYVPGTTSPVTVSLQIATAGGTCQIIASGALAPSIEWTVIQIAT